MFPERRIVIVLDAVVRPKEIDNRVRILIYVTGVEKFNTIKAISYYIGSTHDKDS